MIVISGASKAIRYKSENPKATEEEVIKYITDNVDEILSEVDEEF